MPQIEEHAKNILRPRKAEEVLFWILRKNHGEKLFLGCLSMQHRLQCCACTTLFLTLLNLLLSFFLDGQDSG